MSVRTRSFYAAVACIAYVVLAAVRARAELTFAGAAALVSLPLALWMGFRFSAPPLQGEDRIAKEARTSVRWCWSSTLVWTSAQLAPSGRPAFATVALVAAAVACTTALTTLPLLAPLGGMLGLPISCRRPWAALLQGFATLALGACAAVLVLRQGPSAASDVTLVSFASVTFSFLLLLGETFRHHALRRLELGTPDRLGAALTFAGYFLFVGCSLAAFGLGDAIADLQGALVGSALCIALACTVRHHHALSNLRALAFAAGLLAVPSWVLLASVHRRDPHDGMLHLLLGVLTGVLAGSAAPAVSRALSQPRSRSLAALQRGIEEAARTDPTQATVAALAALREAAGPTGADSELISITDARTLLVDRAGYPHEHPTFFPPSVVTLARDEPRGILRVEVLEALEVRRPDVRPALAWLNDKRLLAVALVQDELGSALLLPLPRGRRMAPMSLEEVKALARLGERLCALWGMSKALERSRARELSERARADAEEDKALRLLHLATVQGGREEQAAERLGRRARVSTYSTASRVATEELRSLGALGIPVSLLVPPGVDAVPYAALVHLSSSRRKGPLVIVDGTDSEDRELCSWQADERSPLWLAHRGTLFIESPSALSPEAQRYLAQSLSERRPAKSGEALDVSIVVSVRSTIDALVAKGEMSSELADWLGDRAVPLPPLAARAEDLRSMIGDRLARLGLRLRGEPLGIESRALARLIEHTWPGNDLELDDVLGRAASVARSEVLTATDLEAIGFYPIESSPRSASARPSRKA